MLHSAIRLSRHEWQDTLMKVLLSLVVLGLLGPVHIRSEDLVPITLQSFAVLLPAVVFGWRVGAMAVSGYILLGALGAPVFAQYQSGWEYLFGVTGGFFFGFLFAALVCGYLAEAPAARKPLPCFGIWVAGHAIILLFGTIWLMRFNPEWWNVLENLLPGAAIKSAFGLLITQLLLRLTLGREAYYGIRRE